MATAKQQQGPWRQAVEVPSTVLFNDGDIHAPLKRVRDQYYARANKLLARYQKSVEEDTVVLTLRIAAEDYRDAGDLVNRLIPKEELSGESNTNPEPEETSQGDSQASPGDGGNNPIGLTEAGSRAESSEGPSAGVPGQGSIATEGQA